MYAKITFKSEVYISGKDAVEIKRKFNTLPIFSNTALNACQSSLVKI